MVECDINIMSLLSHFKKINQLTAEQLAQLLVQQEEQRLLENNALAEERKRKEDIDKPKEIKSPLIYKRKEVIEHKCGVGGWCDDNC